MDKFNQFHVFNRKTVTKYIYLLAEYVAIKIKDDNIIQAERIYTLMLNISNLHLLEWSELFYTTQRQAMKISLLENLSF